MYDFLEVVCPALLFFGLSWYYKRYTPKKINYWYGYRTRRSMANTIIWKEANTLASFYLYILGYVVLFLSIICFFICKASTAIMITVGAYLVGLAFVFLKVEGRLDAKFDKNGNLKQ